MTGHGVSLQKNAGRLLRKSDALYANTLPLPCKTGKGHWISETANKLAQVGLENVALTA